ncbi:MAG: peptidylprolyl isomerase [Pirellulales bacterium]|nr:peptidylprolyl isomerase [Pirellulales bacterium]
MPRVLIKTEKGDVVVELFENEAPNTVANFITLAEKGYYNGTPFHRVLPCFMAQGGDPTGTGSGGPGYSIPDEVSNPNRRNHFRGSLSMAKSDQPDSGGSQFFLCFVPTTYLDGKHTVFGRVVSGIDVLSKIKRCDPDDPNRPDPDKILEMKVLRKRDHEYKVKKTGE